MVQIQLDIVDIDDTNGIFIDIPDGWYLKQIIERKGKLCALIQKEKTPEERAQDPLLDDKFSKLVWCMQNSGIKKPKTEETKRILKNSLVGFSDFDKLKLIKSRKSHCCHNPRCL